MGRLMWLEVGRLNWEVGGMCLMVEELMAGLLCRVGWLSRGKT